VVALVLLVLRRRQYALKSALVTLYATLVLAVVFLPLPGPGTHRPRQSIQLMPMRWVLDFGGGDVRALELVVQNILLFVPLGVLIARARTSLLAGSRSFPPRPTRPASPLGADHQLRRVDAGVLRGGNDRREQGALRGLSPPTHLADGG
jgi:hypothetical protein